MAGNNKNIVADGARTRFSVTNQPAKRGRLPSKLKRFVKGAAVSKADVDAVFSRLVFGSTVEELREMVRPGSVEKLPVMVALFVKAFLEDMERGNIGAAREVLDRLYGKAAQQVEIGEIRSDIPDDPEERRLLAERIRREIAWQDGDGEN